MSEKPYALEIELEGLPHLQSGTWGHWATRRKHDAGWKERIGWEARRLGGKPLLTDAHIDCIRFSAVEPDYDNLVASFKPLVDGLVEAGILVNDSPSRLTRTYAWCNASRSKGRIRICVKERRP